MKILVTGSRGQLGQSIQRISDDYNHQFVFTNVDELDITNRLIIDEYFSKLKPDIVINCAGYTNVEKAESEPEIAYNINCQAVKNLSDISEKYSIKLIHISTDFIFDGNQNVPYTEEYLPSPINIYGMTKYEGEKELLKYMTEGIILRSSWLFSEYRHNFVKTIYNLARNKSELKVVNDQFGSPTYAGDLAVTILEMIQKDNWGNCPQIYHYCNSGVASRFELAQEIVNICGFNCKIIPVSTEEYGAKVIRPKYSALDTSKIRREYSLNVRPWKEALGECLSIIETRDSVLETRNSKI
ncbi:MAG: dTDP-4-dehydrorhamnose reductase [Saprospiraceae bacterium]|nr:dTDP-4-dehydrorhamnose reductase [Saprospiraceae bacterium]